MRTASIRTAIALTLLFSAAAASAQDRDVDTRCRPVKDHYGRSHQDCRPRIVPQCHMAKNHYGKVVKSCDKD